MVQNYHVEMGQGEDSSVPICVQLHPSADQVGNQKREPSAITSRLAKKPKLPDDKYLTGNLHTDEPLKEPAADGSINESPTEPPTTPTNTQTKHSRTHLPLAHLGRANFLLINRPLDAYLRL